MKFRLKAFGLHLLSSATVLTLILGSLYLGWYRWPGWFLADVRHVVVVMIGVDVVLGPLLTLVVANARKPRRELVRDIGIIVAVQLAALIYGTSALWGGRPLYYAFSVDCLSLVQAFDIDRASLEAAQREKSALLPHWYSLPRWIFAPFPEDKAKAESLLANILRGAPDVVAMPQLYKPWESGLRELRTQLQPVDKIRYFGPQEKKNLEARMRAAGLPTDQLNAIALMGRGRPVLVVMDPASLKVAAILDPR